MKKKKTINIKYLFIGVSDYNPSNKKYTNVTLGDYPTDTVAFFPNHKDNDWLKIVSFKRILGLLYNKKISTEDIFCNITSSKSPCELAKNLQEKGIFFCNLDRIKVTNNIQFPIKNFEVEKNKKLKNFKKLNPKQKDNKKHVWKITKSTKILCFGSDPINEITEIVIDNNLPLENLSTFPHPAKNNSHIIWQHYDKNFTPTTYNLKLKNLPDLNTLK